MEIRIEFVNKDNSHSWAKISHGLNKLVTNVNNKDQDDNEQETSEMQFDYVLKSNASDVASRSKAQAKPGEGNWTDINPQKYLFFRLTCLLRHGSPPRNNDGTIEFW